jgi:G3E family GTPase
VARAENRQHVLAAGVIAVVDAEAGREQIDARAEVRAQLACADRLLLSKLDVAPAHEVARLHARLAALAPEAELASFPPGPAGDAALWPWLLERRGLRARGPVSDGHRHGQLSVATFVDGAPLVAEALLGMLGALGPRLLRAKGWVHVAGRQERGFIERAGLRLELRAGEPWAAGESRQSELVLIGDGLDEAELRRGLWACRSAT